MYTEVALLHNKRLQFDGERITQAVPGSKMYPEAEDLRCGSWERFQQEEAWLEGIYQCCDSVKSKRG